MIDLHCHILPELDDGPDTMDEALALVSRARECGTRILVATPHALGGLIAAQNPIIISAFKDFSALVRREFPDLQVHLGSEIYFQPHLGRLIQFEAATINAAGRYMLVEFSMGDIPRGFERELNALRNAQIIPIIAHPERNARVLKNPALVQQMVELGALIQLNAGSLTGIFGRSTKKLAHNLLAMGLAHFLASDAHDLIHRSPDLREALETATAIVGEVEARRLVESNPRIIVSGLPWPGRELAHSVLGDNNG